MNWRSKVLFGAIIIGGLISFLGASPVPPRGTDVVIEPSSLSLTLGRGLAQTVRYKVTVPPEFARPIDIYFLIDTSTGFTSELADVRHQVREIMESFRDGGPMVRFGLGEFSDYPIPPYGSAIDSDTAYRRLVDLTTDGQQVLKTLDRLRSRQGGDSPQSQLVALFQAVTGAGQDLNGDGDFDDLGDIPPHQQASFRPGSSAFILLWTEAPFHRAEDGKDTGVLYPFQMSFEQVCGALNEKGVKVIGIDPAQGGSSSLLAQGLEDLKQVTTRTRTLAPRGGVDFDGDGLIAAADSPDRVDLAAGEPFVCRVSHRGSELAEALQRFAEVSLVPIDNPETEFDETKLVKIDPIRYDSGAVDLKAGGVFEFDVTFRAPNEDEAGERDFTFAVRAKIGNGLFSQAEVNFTAQPPVVTIGTPQEGQRFCASVTTITVTGSVMATGRVTRVQARAERAGMVLSMTQCMITGNTFSCTLTGLTPGPLTIIVVATDGAGNTGMATRNVRINRPPVANAGPDQIVNEQAKVTLDGTKSSDPDGDPLTFRWRLVSASDPRFPIDLMMATTATPMFTAPTLRILDPPCVDYVFELIVNDGCDNSAPSTVRVRVQNLVILRDNRSRNQVTINLCTDQPTFAYEVFVPRSNERFTGRVRIQRGQGDGNQWHIFDANNAIRLSANVDVRRLVGLAVFVVGTREITIFDGNFEKNVP